MRTPFGDVDPRRSARLSMADIDDVLRRPVGRRSVLLAGAASPLLWVRPGHAAVPPAGTHLTFGADPKSEVTVSWSTDGSVRNPLLEFGTTEAYGSRQEPESRTVRGSRTVYHHVALGSLLHATTYHYRLRHDGASTPDRTFSTSPTDPTSTFRFTAFGDQGVTDVAALTAARIAGVKPAFHVHAGDLCYANATGSGGENQEYDAPVWDRWMTQNLVVAKAGIPWMPTVGNHEMEPGLGPQGYDGFLGRFLLPANSASGSRNTWWFRYGNVAVLGLDGNDASNEIPHNRGWLGERQDRWIRSTLTTVRANPKVDFVVVAFHHCAYCSNTVHGSDGGVRDRWEVLFDEFAVDLVVNGHNHSYERTHPLRAGAVTAKAPRGGTVSPVTEGTTYVTAGGGGQSAYREGAGSLTYVVDADGEKVPEKPTWSAVATQDYNILVADSTPLTDGGTTTLRPRAVRPDGTVLDEVTLVRPARAGLRREDAPTPSASTAPSVAPTREPSAAPSGPSPDNAIGASEVAVATAVVGGAALAARAVLVHRRQGGDAEPPA